MDKGKRLWVDDEDEEEPVQIPGELEVTDETVSLCLLGKLWTNRPYNMYGLFETMKKLWCPTKGMICRDMGANLLSFQFHSKRDLERVVAMEPWHFNKHVLVLKPITNETQPSQMKFDKTQFWIRLYDVPMMGRSEVCLKQIGSRFGEVVEIDTSTTDGLTKSVRIRVVLDLNKPIKRGTKIKIGTSTPCWIPATYERLSSFCYWCGNLGHTTKDCEKLHELEDEQGQIKEEANGGMGFRELHFFNIAMLAKQMWNIMQHPESLTHKILKAKYFPRHNILEAGLGFQPSYLWRSLLAAKPIVEDGLAWRIGDGRSVKIASDRWIGLDHPARPMQIIDEDWREEYVGRLIDTETGRWNRNLVQQVFNTTDAKQILSIPIGSSQQEDRRVWRFTKHGFFTVKSAYHRAVQIMSNIHDDRASGSSIPKEWKKIWHIHAIPRVRMFIWRACRNALPTKENLLRRGSELDPICEVCGEAVESVNHVLLHCREAKSVWYGSGLRLDVGSLPNHSFKSFMWTAMHHYPPEYVSLLAYNAWEIWKARNRVCLEGKRSRIHETIRKAYSQWMEIMDVQKKEMEPTRIGKQEAKWKPPPNGKLKLNCDVAIRKGGKIGYGFTLRDGFGHNVLAGKMEEEAMGSSTLLEGLAMRYAMQMVRQYGLKADIIESDYRQLIDGINGKGLPEMYCAVVMDDIRELAKENKCTVF